MAISSPGIGSGLDVNGIVSQLMALERRPLQQLERQRSAVQSELSAFGRLQGAVATMRDAARRLADAATWTATTVSSSNAAAVSATSNGSAPPGSYSVTVARLAAAQTLAMPTALPSANDSLGSGTLTITLGTWAANLSTFTPRAGSTPVSVTIAAGSSLAAVRDAINAANAGVSASIVSDASGARLALRSTSTGIEHGFRIAVTDDDGTHGDASGLSRLAFDPPAGAAQMTRTLAAANAEATINGVAVSSATNTLADVLDGLTLRLSQVTTAPVDLAVARDSAAVRKQITDFANAYNELVRMLGELTSFDAATRRAGALQGDSSAVGLMRQLRNLVGGQSAASAAFQRLADVGLEPQRDGTLRVVDSRLDGALGRHDELRAFFARDAVGTASDGFGVLLRGFGDGALASDGVFSTRREGLQQRIQRSDQGIARMEDRLQLVERRLREQYTRLDGQIAALSGLQSFVTQQLQMFNNNSNPRR